MARQYKITTPDGEVLTVEGPDDATDDELIDFAAEQLSQRGSQYANTRAEVRRPVETPSVAPVGEDLGLSPGAMALKKARDSSLGGAEPGHLTLLNQGAMFGFSDEIAGVGNALGNVIMSPLTGNFDPLQAYADGRDLERYNIRNALERYPVTGLGASILGGFVGASPSGAVAAVPNALAAIKSGAKIGALGGAAGGIGVGDDVETSIAGGVLGGAFGGVLGAALPAAGITLGRSYQGLNRLLGRDQPGLAREIVGNALAADANTGAQAGAIMDRGRALGVPTMLADTGENTRGLTASVGRQPGPSRTIVIDALQARQTGQADRIRGALERDLGPLSNQPVRAAEAQAQARATAAAAREAEAGNLSRSVEAIGPNVDRLASGGQAREVFGDAYGAAKARTSEAYNAPELVNPQPIEIPTSLFAQDIRNAADRFYGDGGGLIPTEVQSIIDDLAAEGATTRTLTNIDRRLADFAGRERVSGNRSDAAFAENVRRSLGDFVDRAAPAEYRAALTNAKAIRAEQGRVFETRDLPRAFANDRFGNPLVGDTSVPERLTRPGAPGGDTADSLAQAIGAGPAEDLMRQEFRRVLEALPELTPSATQALNTRYAEAAQRFPALASDLAAVNRHATSVAAASAAEREAGREGSTAIERGYAAVNMSPDEVGRAISGLSPADLSAFGEGYRNRLSNEIGRRVDDADKVRALVGTPNRRGVLEQIFPGEGLDRFGATMAAEQAANQTFRSATQGSHTAERLAYDAQTQDAGLAETAVDAALRASKENLWSSIVAGLQKLRETSRFGVGEAGQRVRESVATLLTETDPAELRRIIAEANAAAIAREQRDAAIAGAAVRTSAGLAPGAVVAGGNVGR